MDKWKFAPNENLENQYPDVCSAHSVGHKGKLTMKQGTIRRSLQRGYDERGVFEPDEEFWSAVKQIIIWLQKKSKTRRPKMKQGPRNGG